MINFLITISILAIGATIIVVYVFNYKPRRNSKVKDLYAEGLDLLITGRRKSAYKNFKEIIEKDSNNIKAYIRLGQVLREGGSVNQALKVHRGLRHRKGLSFYEQIELHKNLALNFYKLSQLDAAIAELHQILKLEKNSEWALSKLTAFYREKYDWAKAGDFLERYQKQVKKENKFDLALYKVQEGRLLIKSKSFKDARKTFENALNICPDLAVTYYFIGNSYSSESEEEYQKAVKNSSLPESLELENSEHMSQAEDLLAKAIPMWIRYAELKPEQAWMVIHLLKDSLFALDRYSEFEDILKHILKSDSDNIEVIASLSEIYSHRGENSEAVELIDSAIDQDPTSIIVKLIKIKLQAKKEGGSLDFTKGLDDIIHFLVRDERFQRYKNTATDPHIIWLYETSDDKEVLK